MVRETESGLRYLEKRGDGERVVKEGFDTSQLFMLGGVHHDAGLEYPVVPLGGSPYFNVKLFNKGLQTNLFFAGVVLMRIRAMLAEAKVEARMKRMAAQ